MRSFRFVAAGVLLATCLVGYLQADTTHQTSFSLLPLPPISRPATPARPAYAQPPSAPAAAQPGYPLPAAANVQAYALPAAAAPVYAPPQATFPVGWQPAAGQPAAGQPVAAQPMVWQPAAGHPGAAYLPAYAPATYGLPPAGYSRVPTTMLPGAATPPAVPVAGPYAPAYPPVAPATSGTVYRLMGDPPVSAPQVEAPAYDPAQLWQSQPLSKAAGRGPAHWLAGVAGSRLGCNTPWFGSVSGLLMSRDNEEHYLFSYDDANESVQLTNSRDTNFEWSGGFDVRLGRYFNCGRNAVEGVYWGLFPSSDSTLTTSADTVGALNGILNWDQLNYGLDMMMMPRTADQFVNNSNAHLLTRDNEIHNVELNLLHFCGPCNVDPCGNSRLRHSWLAGVRFFKFHDNLLFGAEENGGNGRFLLEDDEIYYNIDIDNNLIGVQVGATGEYLLTCRWSLDYGFKFGVFNNQIDHVSEIGGSQGVAVINNGPNMGTAFFVDSSKDDVAFLGEANLGLSWCYNDCWTVALGYRAVAVTGIAHPTEQIYHDLRGIQDVQWVDSGGSLILHGGYAAVEFCY